MQFPDSHLSDEELEKLLKEASQEFESHKAELERFDRIMKRAIMGFVLGVCLLFLVAIVGCADNREQTLETPCRMDQAGPPAPWETRPLCKGYI